MSIQPLSELLAVDEPAWPLVQQWITRATNPVEVLAFDPEAREKALAEVQVTLRSPLGAVIYETGGLLVDHGWIRILGSGHPRLRRSLPAWNADKAFDAAGCRRGLYLVADDMLGGFFAMNGGAFGTDDGHLYYLAPDLLRWEPMRFGYSQFLHWCFGGNLQKHYEPYRWAGWEDDVAAVHGDEALSVSPPLFTEGPRIDRRRRRAVPIDELFGMHAVAVPRQLGYPTPF